MNFCKESKKCMLGSGSYGSVYKMEIDNVEYACKRFRSSLHQKPFKWSHSAVREIVCMSFFSESFSNHLMKLIFATFDEKGRVVLVFPLMKCNAFTWINQNKLSTKTVLDWTFQLIQAVKNLHLLGFVHRDIKLENILVNEQNSIVLADFGMSRFMPIQNQKDEFFTGNICSLWTRPPELFSKQRELHNSNKHSIWYDDTVDSWSTGCVLYAFMAGKYMFHENDEQSVYDEIIKCCNRTREERLQLLKIDVARNDIPEELYYLVVDLLHIDPMNRKKIVDCSPDWIRVEDQTDSQNATRLNNSKNEESLHPKVISDFTIVSGSTENPVNTNLQWNNVTSTLTRKYVGIWIWKTVESFGLHPSTSLYALFLWCKSLHLFKSREIEIQDSLLAAASCSLCSKANESKIITSKHWSKAIGLQTSKIEEAENNIFRFSNGKLFPPSNELRSLHSSRYLARAFCLFVSCEIGFGDACQLSRGLSLFESPEWINVIQTVPTLTKHAQ